MGNSNIISYLNIFRNNHSYLRFFSENQFYQRKEQNLKRKTPEEQQQTVCGVHQVDAKFVSDLEKMCISETKLGPVDLGPNNNYY